jgi:hypothetical protein
MKLLVAIIMLKTGASQPVSDQGAAEAYLMPPGIVSAEEFTDPTRVYRCTDSAGYVVTLAWGQIAGRLDPAEFTCVDAGANPEPIMG